MGCVCVCVLALNIKSVRFSLLVWLYFHVICSAMLIFFSCIFSIAFFGSTTLNWSIFPWWTFKLVPYFTVVPSTLMHNLVTRSLYLSMTICRTVLDLAGSVRSMNGGRFHNRLFERSGMSPQFFHLSLFATLKEGYWERKGRRGGRRAWPCWETRVCFNFLLTQEPPYYPPHPRKKGLASVHLLPAGGIRGL